MTTISAVCGVIGSALNVYSYILPGFQKAYWIVSLYADTPFKPKTKLKYVFTVLKENSISWKMLSEFFRPNHVIHLMEIKYFISQYFFTYIWFGTMILSMLSYWNSTYVLTQNKKNLGVVLLTCNGVSPSILMENQIIHACLVSLELAMF